jgi:hypothetical protein
MINVVRSPTAAVYRNVTLVHDTNSLPCFAYRFVNIHMIDLFICQKPD